MSVTFGSVSLRNGIFLAPMAGVTDRTFRLLCRRFGAEYLVSEMVSAKALCYEQRAGRKEASGGKTAPLAAVTKAETPMAVQLFGNDPQWMAEAAQWIESGTYRGCVSETPPVAIDVNMGCPVRKIAGNGEGSALMKNPRLAEAIVSAMVRAVRLPITVKIRAGWDSQSVNAVEIAKAAEAAGASLVCVHARTREQMYAPGIDRSVIAAVKRELSIPVIGNGDIRCAEDALTMLRETGCDGVMIGRGAMGNPWIFSELTAALENKAYKMPSRSERMAVALEQLEGMLIHKGERVGLAEAKKHMAWYLNGVNGAAAARAAIMTATTSEEVRMILRTWQAEEKA